jgi:hypothetical protein
MQVSRLSLACVVASDQGSAISREAQTGPENETLVSFGVNERSKRHLDAAPAFICPHVIGGHPVLLVSKADGDWQLACGALHEDAEGWSIAHLGHLLDSDPSLEEILDMHDDFEAERDVVGGRWTRRRSSES